MNSNLTFIVISSRNDLSVEKTLESIVGVAPILLIDGGSRKFLSQTDQEISLFQLANLYGCEYRAREFLNASDQYNFGIETIATEWAFIIDSDETLSSELREFLRKDSFNGATHYLVKRFNYFLGRKMRHGQFRPDWNTRLIRKEFCKYENRSVHARMLTSGRRLRAPGFIIHHTVNDVSSFFLKMLAFTSREVESRKSGHSNEVKAQIRGILQKLPFQPSLRFIYSYWFRLGFLDGKIGYLVARSASYYEIMVELQNLEQHE